MKIGILLINSDPSYRGGVNSYVHGIISGFVKADKKNDYSLLVYERNKKVYEQYLSKNFHLVTFKNENVWIKRLKIICLMIFTAPFFRKLYPYVEKILYISLIKGIEKLDFDVLYSPSAPNFPLLIGKKTIVSPHDIQFFHYPNYFSLMDRWYRATVIPISLQLARVVQVSSNKMSNDINRSLKISPKKIVVIPEGVADTFLNFRFQENKSRGFLKKYSLKKGYIFYPAQHWPHKNHITLLKAMMYLKRRYSMEITAVFTGKVESKYRFLYDFIDQNSLRPVVKMIGNIEFEELPYAYRNALMTVLPVIYGPSIPIKEGMAIGTPVIASRNGVNDEVNLDNNIMLFGPTDYKELAGKIRTLVKSKKMREGLVLRSKKLIGNFSWQKVAGLYVNVFLRRFLKKSIFTHKITGYNTKT